jgi:hypothetical protein
MIFDYPFAVLPSHCLFQPVAGTKLSRTNEGYEFLTQDNAARWRIVYSYDILPRSEGQQILNVLKKLHGHKNHIRLKDYDYDHSTWPGSQTVRGNDNEGLLLDIQSDQLSQTLAGAGARFVLGNRLHEVLDDVITDAAGHATLTLANELLQLPNANQVLLTNPSQLLATCRWSNPREIEQFTGSNRYYRNIKLTFEEAFNFD